jgi:hypothetical protein
LIKLDKLEQNLLSLTELSLSKKKKKKKRNKHAGVEMVGRQTHDF